MKHSPSSPSRVVLVLCVLVVALAAIVAQMVILSELPTLAASLQRGVDPIRERTHDALARLASAEPSADLDAPQEQAQGQAPSVPLVSSPERAVRAAWQHAQQAGSYRFMADIRQIIVPKSTVLNVGRAAKEEALHLEGEANPHQQQLHLTLWSQGGSVVNPGSGVEIKVNGGRAYARTLSPSPDVWERGPGGEGWQEIPNFTGLFAPQGDFMAFLAAAKNVKPYSCAKPQELY